MRREEQVLQTVEENIEESKRPSAKFIAQELSWTEEDVHRCLNILEKKGKIRTYTKELLDEKRRMIGVIR